MSKTSLVCLVIIACVIAIILAVDNHDKNVKINVLKNNVTNLYLENSKLKKDINEYDSLVKDYKLFVDGLLDKR